MIVNTYLLNITCLRVRVKERMLPFFVTYCNTPNQKKGRRLPLRQRPSRQQYYSKALDFDDISSLEPFGPLLNVERNRFAFGQCFEPFALDRREMHEHVFTTVLLNKTKAFGIVKPFNFTFWQRTSPPLSNVESVQILESKEQAEPEPSGPCPVSCFSCIAHWGDRPSSIWQKGIYLISGRQP